MSWAIGIDFGTSRSAGAIGELTSTSGSAGPLVSPLEIEGNRWVASMVLRTPEGELVLGTAAENLAGVHPDRLERTPKRALGTAAPLLLGGEPIDPRDAAAAVIATIVAEGRLRAGGVDPTSCVLTHPVRWADVRRAALRDAGERAGLKDPILVEEPVAAAIHYAAEHVGVGAHVGVYDLGGGTFDTAVLQRTPNGFDVIGVPGGDENIGGENFDHRLFRYFGECLAETTPELWEQILTHDDRRWKRAALDLLIQARRAKEALSSYTSTQIFVPVADRDILINRSQFEAMIVDDVERTVDIMEDTVLEAGLSIDDLAAVFLVGGSSRLPLVSQMVSERFGSKVQTRDEPKGVVALGAARLAALRLRPTPTAQADPGSAARSAAGAAGSAAGSVEPSSSVAQAAATDTNWLDHLPPPLHEQRIDVPVVSSVPVDSSGPAVGPVPAVAAVVPPVAPAAQMPPPTLRPPTVLATPPVAREPDAVVPVGIAWRLAVDQTPGLLRADIDAVVFGSRDGSVRCVNPRSGQLVWRAMVGSAIWAAPALAHDLVVVGSLDGRVFALDRASGTLRWTLTTTSPIAASPVVIGGTVMVANDAGQLIGIEGTTGAVRWNLAVGAAVRADLVPAGSAALVATAAGQVFMVDSVSGACHWGYRASMAVLAAPAVASDRVLVPCQDGVVYGLEASSGRALYGVRCSAPCATSVVAAGSVFAVIDTAGILRVHQLGDGQVVTEMVVSGSASAGMVLLPTGAPTSAVVETGGGNVLAVDLATRDIRFSVPTGQGNRSSPVASGGLAVVATTFGQVYGIVVS